VQLDILSVSNKFAVTEDKTEHPSKSDRLERFEFLYDLVCNRIETVGKFPYRVTLTPAGYISERDLHAIIRA
jgi:hypothetical protein